MPVKDRALAAGNKLGVKLIPRLPNVVKRLFSGGRAVVIDGNTLDPSLQLLLSAQRAIGVESLVVDEDAVATRAANAQLTRTLDERSRVIGALFLMLGGIGSCGRPLCCQTFLRNFQPVGIRVAKDQGISLNPSKISGVCDRLMCCLRFEHQQYLDMAKELPGEGDIVTTPQGEGRVVDCHIIAEEVVVKLDTETLITVPADSVKLKTDTARQSKRRRNRPSGRRKRR